MMSEKFRVDFIEPAMTYEDIVAQQVSKVQKDKPSGFKVSAQLLDQGRTDTVLAASAGLTVRLKVYASGGENALHTHVNEDHVFILLAGSAEFHNETGFLANLKQHEGILIPKGSFYKFHATSTEPLVMLRIGSPNESFLGLEGRVNTHGDKAHADSSQNMTQEVVFKANEFFGQ
jgi:mannose-6-phosphate isomerase-like protein (cupin superfamily)